MPTAASVVRLRHVLHAPRAGARDAGVTLLFFYSLFFIFFFLFLFLFLSRGLGRLVRGEQAGPVRFMKGVETIEEEKEAREWESRGRRAFLFFFCHFFSFHPMWRQLWKTGKTQQQRNLPPPRTKNGVVACEGGRGWGQPKRGNRAPSAGSWGGRPLLQQKIKKNKKRKKSHAISFVFVFAGQVVCCTDRQVPTRCLAPPRWLSASSAPHAGPPPLFFLF